MKMKKKTTKTKKKTRRRQEDKEEDEEEDDLPLSGLTSSASFGKVTLWQIWVLFLWMASTSAQCGGCCLGSKLGTPREGQDQGQGYPNPNPGLQARDRVRVRQDKVRNQGKDRRVSFILYNTFIQREPSENVQIHQYWHLTIVVDQVRCFRMP